MKVPLTQGKEAVIDDADAAVLAGYSWQAVSRGTNL